MRALAYINFLQSALAGVTAAFKPFRAANRAKDKISEQTARKIDTHTRTQSKMKVSSRGESPEGFQM